MIIIANTSVVCLGDYYCHQQVLVKYKIFSLIIEGDCMEQTFHTYKMKQQDGRSSKAMAAPTHCVIVK